MAGIDVFVDAGQITAFSNGPSSARNLYMTIIVNGILTAASTGLKTFSATTSSKAAADVLYALTTLKSLGYGADLVSTNLVITWS